ncbi:MAG TPA: VWA-like domain-containing protein [Longimicrobium sp.]|nr:VWA-like domain-containing protein [Longimicrobium sp.]
MSRKRGAGQANPAAEAWWAGVQQVNAHPLFAPLAHRANIWRSGESGCPADGWAVVHESGRIEFHPTRRGDPAEWAYVTAHALLHLGFEHFRPERLQHWREWTAACDCFVARFLADLRFGRPPADVSGRVDLPARTEAELFALFVERGIPPELSGCGVGGSAADMVPMRTAQPARPALYAWGPQESWGELLSRGLSQAVRSAVSVAAGRESALGSGQGGRLTAAQRAREWFIHSYPLLGALAAAFRVIEDAELCRRLDISIAAVDDASQEIYMNPFAGLDEEECRFVMAHELLHAGLRHQARRQGREPYLWNVACDYVVNQWLVEMGIGQVPRVGVLLDPELKGLSAEAVYDRIVTDLRRYRKLATLRGVGLGDMLERRPPNGGEIGEGVTLDELYRNALSQGLHVHQESGRGLLPAGLVDEIRALHMPPIPWEVELARWFDERFSPLERYRTFARPSRRQASTPHIPRPRWAVRPESMHGRTFGVVLDTSGSMGSELLAKALGTIASYAVAREVPAVRVVFCDAAAYDAGYMAPEEIAGRVRVRGRGGTVLQPGVDLLERAEDFPDVGPILLITDGQCDRVRIRRDHAILIPAGATLPFVPAGRVFRVR